MKDNLYFESLEETTDDFVDFGDISRVRLGIQCQYGSRYINGEISGWPNLGEELRFKGDDHNYHSFKIHRDDVEEFIRRVELYRKEMLE